MKATTLPPPLVTPADLRRHFAVSRWTVDAWVKAGCPVTTLPSGHKRYDLTAVKQWMDEQAGAEAA